MSMIHKTFRCWEYEWKKWEEKAAQEGLSTAEFIRRACNDVCDLKDALEREKHDIEQQRLI